MITTAMNLQRLGHMDVAEIAGRARVEASKWWDRVAVKGAEPRAIGTTAECRRRLQAFREDAARRFFAVAADKGAPGVLAGRMPEHVRDLTARAEQSLHCRFDLLGYRGLSFGLPVDWHLDPVSRRRAPLAHWSRLDPLDAGAVGDSKVVWELNRHQWLATLGQAYRVTRDERYAAAFSAYVSHWLLSNPVGRGLNWSSSLEVAFRVIAWCWALVLFARSPALTPELFARIRASIEDHAKHIERYLSHYFSPNTHLTGEALGLFYAGTVFPDLGRAARWRERGARILADEMGRQVLSDGVYFEQSTCYQRYTVEILLHFLILCAGNDQSVPERVRDRAQAMLDFLLAVRSPRGGAPAIGDADGGWLLPLVRREPDDLRGVFATAAALFERPDYAWAASGPGPEIIWLLGTSGLATFDALRAAAPTGPASRLFEKGGYASMRSGWEPDAHHLLFDVGPLGCPVSGGHGHADLLSVQCWAFGEPFLADAGTGSYADPDWRRFFRSTAAHSTVMVDGESQAVPAGPFSWRQRPRARLRSWLSTEAFDYADADHDAYRRLSDPVRHRRRVLFVKPRYWVLVDDVEGAGQHLVELRFQFGPAEVRLGPGLWASAAAGGRGMLLCPFASASLQPRLREGALEPAEGWVSPHYGQRRPAPVVVYSASTRLPLRVITLLVPGAALWAPPPPVSVLVRDGGEPTGLVFGAGEETVTIQEGDGRLVHQRREDRSATDLTGEATIPREEA